MQLLRYTDYALRTLVYVAAHPDRPVSAAAIAQAYGISSDHVAKATKALTRAGMLRSTRGAGGGVQLAQPAAAIGIGAVVRLFEGQGGIVECFVKGAPTCAIVPACVLRRAFKQAELAFFDELDRYSLADVLEQRTALIRLLPAARSPRGDVPRQR
jgi:Rrf2 family transcriptional regulator, nitric oxide-sensitive transcriptional repressor